MLCYVDRNVSLTGGSTGEKYKTTCGEVSSEKCLHNLPYADVNFSKVSEFLWFVVYSYRVIALLLRISKGPILQGIGASA